MKTKFYGEAPWPSSDGTNAALPIPMNPKDSLSLATCSIDMRFESKDTEQAVRLLLSVRRNIQAKRGCRACEIGMDAADPVLVHYLEEWESAEHFHRHVRSEEFRRVLIAVDLCCEEPKIVVGNLSGRNGMEHLRKLREEGDRTPIAGE
jgi:quinol monooxygenase YgiN